MSGWGKTAIPKCGRLVYMPCDALAILSVKSSPRIDSIEHLPVESVAAGNGFTVLAGKLDGRLMGVGGSRLHAQRLPQNL